MSTRDTVAEVVDRSGGMGLDGVSNVLVLSPTLSGDARRSYLQAFLPDDSSQLSVLAIDYRRTPEEWIEEWREYVGEAPRECSIVSVGDTTRGAATKGVSRKTVTTVDSPDDLTGLGITISEYLSQYGGTDSVVTFDSLTVLLQYVDLQRVFRFLHVLSGRVRAADSAAHFHLDPDAHDRQVVATLESLFDAVVEYDDGEWSVRKL